MDILVPFPLEATAKRKGKKEFQMFSLFTFHPSKREGAGPASHTHTYNVRPRTGVTLSLGAKYNLAWDSQVASLQEQFGDDFLVSLPTFGQDHLMRVLSVCSWCLCENILHVIGLEVTAVHEMPCSVVIRLV